MTYKFENGLGARVIDDGYGREGLFEIALLKDGKVVYNKELGFESSVKGWLLANDAVKVLTDISEYDPEGKYFLTNPKLDPVFD